MKSRRQELQETRLIPTPIARWLRPWIYCLGLVIGLATEAGAQTIPSTTIDEADGLLDLSITGVGETAGHLMVIATQNGAYVFNGKRTLRLGSRAGLPDRAEFIGLTIAAGQVALYTADTVYTARDVDGFIDKARFDAHPVAGVDGSLNDLVAVPEGLLVVQSYRVSLYDTALRQIVAMPHRLSARLQIGRGDRIIRAAVSMDEWWYVTQHGWICHVHAGHAACSQPGTSGRDGGFGRPLLLADGTAYVRNLKNMLHLDRDGKIVTIEALPDQEWSEHGFSFFYVLAPTPDGDILTQSAHGVIVRHDGKWSLRRTGTTSFPLVLAFDHGGSLWFSPIGRGLSVVTGFDRIQNFTKDDGLISDTIWAITQAGDGSIWVGSSGGIDRIGSADNRITHVRDVDGNTIVALDRGRLLATDGPEGLSGIDTQSLAVSTSDVPDIQKLSAVSSSATAWGIGPRSIYHFDQHSAPVPDGHADTASLNLNLINSRWGGRAWTLDEGGLSEWQMTSGVVSMLHRIARPWDADFAPTILAQGGRDTLWAGGPAGLCRLELSSDHQRVDSRACFDGHELGVDSVVSILVDHLGRLWAGTSSGLATFNGHSWQVIDRAKGLIWNDLDQDALFEDAGGGLWIGTSQGLSHLRDPTSVLHQAPLAISISRVMIDRRPWSGGPIAFKSGGLTAELGSPGSTTPSRLVFRYRVAGVDNGWNQSSSGQISYPYLPWGHLRLIAQAVDRLDHTASPPAAFDLIVARPWYLRTEAMIAWLLALISAIALLAFAWSSFINRKRIAHARQLEALVARRTAELEAAHREVKHQARVDGLTGIANRMAIEQTAKAMIGGGQALSLLLIDVDYFKKVNDTHGHMAGDRVLQEVATRLERAMQDTEACGRFGGEEFLVCLSTEREKAAARAREILSAITDGPIFVGNDHLRMTCSAGLAFRQPWDTWETCLGRADTALYSAKQTGRDRLILGEPTPAPHLSVVRPSAHQP